MKTLSIVYYLAALVLILLFMSSALPFLKNLLPGVKLVIVIFPIIFILLTHFSPAEILTAFKLAGRNSRGTPAAYRNAALFFRTMQNLLTLFMLLGIPVIIIWFLATPQSDPPQIANIVRMIVGAFFFPLIFILFISIPFKSALQKKLNDLEDRAESRPFPS